jgi:hypothetical protein
LARQIFDLSLPERGGDLWWTRVVTGSKWVFEGVGGMSRGEGAKTTGFRSKVGQSMENGLGGATRAGAGPFSEELLA